MLLGMKLHLYTQACVLATAVSGSSRRSSASTRLFDGLLIRLHPLRMMVCIRTAYTAGNVNSPQTAETMLDVKSPQTTDTLLDNKTPFNAVLKGKEKQTNLKNHGGIKQN